MTYTAAGSNLTMVESCPIQATIPSAYTAQGNALIVRGMPDIFGTPTFTRQ
jgi:hypothetical protein